MTIYFKINNSVLTNSVVDGTTRHLYILKDIYDYERICQEAGLPVHIYKLVDKIRYTHSSYSDASADNEQYPILCTLFMIECLGLYIKTFSHETSHVELLLSIISGAEQIRASREFVDFLCRFYHFIFKNLLSIKERILARDTTVVINIKHLITSAFKLNCLVPVLLQHQLFLLMTGPIYICHQSLMDRSQDSDRVNACEYIVDSIKTIFCRNIIFLPMFVLSKKFISTPSALLVPKASNNLILLLHRLHETYPHEKVVVEPPREPVQQHEFELAPIVDEPPHVCNVRFIGGYENAERNEHVLLIGEWHTDPHECIRVFNTANIEKILEKYDQVLLEANALVEFTPYLSKDPLRKWYKRAPPKPKETKSQEKNTNLLSIPRKMLRTNSKYAKKILPIDYREFFMNFCYQAYLKRYPEFSQYFLYQDKGFEFVTDKKEVSIENVKNVFYFLKFLYDNYLQLIFEALIDNDLDYFKLMPPAENLFDLILCLSTGTYIKFPLDIDGDMALIEIPSGLVQTLGTIRGQVNYYNILYSTRLLIQSTPIIEIFLINFMHLGYFRNKRTVLILGNNHINNIKRFISADSRWFGATKNYQKYSITEIESLFEKLTGIKLDTSGLVLNRWDSLSSLRPPSVIALK